MTQAQFEKSLDDLAAELQEAAREDPIRGLLSAYVEKVKESESQRFMLEKAADTVRELRRQLTEISAALSEHPEDDERAGAAIRELLK